MSRSYRKPTRSCGGGSDSVDKLMARRGIRRRQNWYLRQDLDLDAFLLPHRLETPSNEKYTWNSDGGHGLAILSKSSFKFHLEALDCPGGFWCKHGYDTWPPEWYVKAQRK